MENQFIVDLGTLKLTEEQRASMNSAIQRAAAAELANIGAAQRLILIPAFKWKKGLGPIINGIIARQINEQMFKEVIR
jgi:hypothetical protein